MSIALYVLTAALYGGLTLTVWRRADQSATRGGAPIVRRSYLSRLLLLAALVSHGALLYTTIFLPEAMSFGFAFALSVMLWLSVGIYWLESFFFALDGLKLLVSPIAGIASFLPLIFDGNAGGKALPYTADPIFKLHFVMANIADGCFALVALHAVLMLGVERKLHIKYSHAGRCAVFANGWFGGWLDALPPLLTLERLLFRLIGAGFLLLTAALISGVLFSQRQLTPGLHFDHETVFALLSWAMFGAVLLGRRFYGWRGRAALRWVLSAFGVLLLAYIGSRFIYECGR